MARRCTQCAAASYPSTSCQALSVLDGDVAFGYWRIIPNAQMKTLLLRLQSRPAVGQSTTALLEPSIERSECGSVAERA
jgi:hypothetical protein